MCASEPIDHTPYVYIPLKRENPKTIRVFPFAVYDYLTNFAA